MRSDSHHISYRSIEMSDEFSSTLASIQDLFVWMTSCLDQLESSRHEPPRLRQAHMRQFLLLRR